MTFKKTTTLLCGIAIFAIACTSSAKKEKESESSTVATKAWISYPADVMAIIDNKCLGCHSPESKNSKAKEDLIWEDLPTMKKMYVGKALYEILEVLEEGSMPPEKMLAKHPEKKLTDEEVAILTKWAEDALVVIEQ